MKKMMFISIIITVIMVVCPFTVMKEAEILPTTAVIPDSKPDEITASDSFRVSNTETGETEIISSKEYIFSVVAAEMPALYESEALKAQAVAAYTFACRRKAENSEKTYDITTDSNTDQGFISRVDAMKRWGEKAEEYAKKIDDAVEATEDLMITYKGQPISAVYHAISSGKTESCENVWGEALPYLKSVVSEGDRLSPDYITEVTFSADQLKDKLSEITDFSGKEESYFGKSSTTASKTVKEISICNQKITGAKIRSLLNLRSSAFEVKYTDGQFIFTVYGYGHGVGMSQYGANYMAKQGYTFKEILSHYYIDCKIEKVK